MVGMPRQPTPTSSSSSSRSTRTAPVSPGAASSRPRRTHRPGRPDHNVAPTKQAPVVLARAPREDRDAAARRQLRLLTWGLVPSWSKDPKGRRPDDQRPRRVGRRQAGVRPRARLPALPGARHGAGTSGRSRRRRSTRRASRASSRSSPHGPTAPASRWRASTSSGATRRSPTPTTRWRGSRPSRVITGPAEPGLDRIHDRQPLVLEPEEWATWLDPAHRRRRRAGPARASDRPGDSRPTPSPPP